MTPNHTEQPENTGSVSTEPAPKKSSKVPAVIGKAKRAAHKKRASVPQKPKALRRTSSKTDKVVALLERSKGASLDEMMQATGWQAHSVRGFLSATVKKNLHLKLASEKDDKGTRRYRVKSRVRA